MILLLLGIIYTGYGVSALIMYRDIGGISLRSGTIIYGKPALITAILLTLFGIFSILLFMKQRKVDSETDFQVGEHHVVVKNKNTTLGAVQSLTLQFENGQQITFYCSAQKVASSLLNEFELEEKNNSGHQKQEWKRL